MKASSSLLFFIVLQSFPSANAICAGIEQICRQVSTDIKWSHVFCARFTIPSKLAVDRFHHKLAAIQELQEAVGLPPRQVEGLRVCFLACCSGISKSQEVFFDYRFGGFYLVVADFIITAAKDQVILCADAFSRGTHGE